MSDEHREIERKLRVHALFRLPPLDQIDGVSRVERLPTVTLVNHYYDTDDLRLFRWGITLRRRDGGHDEGWHLKVPVSESDRGARDEIRFPTEPELPEALRRMITAFVRERDPKPLVTLRTERTPYLLYDDAGTVRGELVDDSVTVLDGDRSTAMFREIEVEAVPDESGRLDDAFIDRVADSLTEGGAVPSTMSKAATALGPRTLAPPDVPDVAWPSPDAPVADAITAFLALHTRRLILEDLRMRRGLPDAVHQMRVSARRLRSGLKAFHSFFEPGTADALRTELGWMASGLGGARDSEVLQQRLDEHCAQLPPEQATQARAIIDSFLRTAASGAEADVGALIDEGRYRDLFVSLVAFVQRPPFTAAAHDPCALALPPVLHRALRRLERRVRDLDPAGPAAPWHEARIAAKGARYVADACAPVLGPRVAELAGLLAEVTDVLGTHQDAHVAQQTLANLAEAADGPGGFALGMLQQVEITAEMADRARFATIWPRVRKATRRAARATGDGHAPS